METTSICLAVFAGLFVISIIISILGNYLVRASRSSGTDTRALSAEENAMLVSFMEKARLARDVHLSMYRNWCIDTFSRSAYCNQNSMDDIKQLLERFKLNDPLQPVPGVFTDADLQATYDQLVASGSQSLIDGLKAGANIEESNLVDIQHAMDVTTHPEVLNLYRRLMEASQEQLGDMSRRLQPRAVTMLHGLSNGSAATP